MVPILFRPRLLGLRNAVRFLFRRGAPPGREAGIVLFSALLIYFIYRGALSAFVNFRSTQPFASLDPSIPLGLFLGLLFGMILLSSCASALGAFYLGHDLELILSKPVPFSSFFAGKTLDTAIQSAWMMAVFAVPTLAGMGAAYHASWDFYLTAAVVLVPFLVLPCVVGIMVVSLVARVVPVGRTREILFFGAALTIIGSYLYARGVIPTATHPDYNQQVGNLLSLLEAAQSPWLPSFWAAFAITRPIAGTVDPVFSVAPMLILMVGSLVGIGACYYIVRAVHGPAYSRAKSNPHGLRIDSALGQSRLRRYLPFVPMHYRALWAKEMKLFARDITQTIQLLLLLGICLVYLYNFKVVNRVGSLPDEAQLWWKGALVICNTGMGAFVITAVSTRFVFSSVSLEGNSFWILQSAPLSIGQLLRVKFATWFIPLGTISSIVFGSGALAIDADPSIVVMSMLVSWILSYGIVGLAVGMGALFANFQWENSSQISASFGSLVYMLAGSLLVLLDIIPLCILVVLETLRASGLELPMTQWLICIGSTCLLLMYINYAASRWAMRSGEQALAARAAS